MASCAPWQGRAVTLRVAEEAEAAVARELHDARRACKVLRARILRDRFEENRRCVALDVGHVRARRVVGVDHEVLRTCAVLVPPFFSFMVHIYVANLITIGQEVAASKAALFKLL